MSEKESMSLLDRLMRYSLENKLVVFLLVVLVLLAPVWVVRVAVWPMSSADASCWISIAAHKRRCTARRKTRSPPAPISTTCSD